MLENRQQQKEKRKEEQTTEAIISGPEKDLRKTKEEKHKKRENIYIKRTVQYVLLIQTLKLFLK